MHQYVRAGWCPGRELPLIANFVPPPGGNQEELAKNIDFGPPRANWHQDSYNKNEYCIIKTAIKLKHS